MGFLCFFILATVSVSAEAIHYSSLPEDGFYGDHVNGFTSVLNGRNMQQEEGRHPSASSINAVHDERDLHALLSFKNGITSDPSRYLSNWTAHNSHNICSWYGVRCRRNSRRVVHLDLHASDLEGNLSSSLGSLSLLNTLNLSANYLTGGIPPAFGQLKALRVLDLTFNLMLGGSVPKSPFNCRHLKSIELAETSLTGTLPTEIGRLLELEHLDLSFNSLNGSIPTFLGNCTSLSYLDLSRNHLSGHIPPTLSNCTSLSYLGLLDNSLSGHIPPTLRNGVVYS